MKSSLRRVVDALDGGLRRPRGAPWHDPQYCRRRFKRPRKIMALTGITSDGSRFLEFLKPNQMMNSDLYCKLLKKKALKIVKQRNLIILHDRSNIHSSRKTEAFLKTERMKSIKLPGKSYDLNPIEKVRRLWTGMSNDYLF